VLAQREMWPVIRSKARQFVEQERTWASSVARYGKVYQRALAMHGHAQSIGT
jgi:glycogen synthase